MEDYRMSTDENMNIERFDKLLRVGESFDIIKRELDFEAFSGVMYYIDGFVKAETMQKLIMHLMGVKSGGDGESGAARRFARSVPAVEVDTEDDLRAAAVAVLSGCTAFFSQSFCGECLIIDARTYPAREASEPENDKVMRGSRDGFVETLIFNTAMLRRRIRDPRLTVKYVSVGSESETDVALCYMEGIADREYVDTLLEKLRSCKAHSVTLGHRSLAEALLKKGWLNPFPKIRATERPDAAAASVLEGSVAVICDNSPEVMLFPVSYFSFLQETDDFYFPPLTGSYLRIVRHTVFLLTVFITPVWYLLLLHADTLPQYLMFIIPKSPGQLPILFQLLLTEFVLDGLKLASLNTPDALSSSLSVVGGLLLGDFAVQTGWLCSDVILYMSFVAIANFTQSSYELGYAFKFVRIITLVLTALFGIVGFCIGAFIGFFLVCTNKTADGKRRYLYPLCPFNGKALLSLLLRLKKRH